MPYLTARDEKVRQHHLDELVTIHAAPLIRQVLRRRLGFYVSAQGVNGNNQDAEDLYQEAMTRVVQVLHQLYSASDQNIDNFDLYVSRIASNSCTDFLRAKSPARTRLKDGLRHLLKRHKDLVSWEHDGAVLCGFGPWRNTGKSQFSDQPWQDVETKLETFQSLHFSDEDVHFAPISQIAAELFYWIGGPVELDVLVGMIAYLLDIQDEQIESLDDPSPAKWDAYFISSARSGESHVEANELLMRLWQAVIHLPADQRDAFALSFEDEAGEDLFTMLRAAEIVNWDEIARGMGRSVQEVVRLRARMPMNGVSVAEELKASRENVYKWRFRAVRRLKAEVQR
ncbi:MAG TPA: sigma-70 family RNA polymerase sigma factor [Pyrinomonadaceae bacterium]|nr:sigma-70 family RNA polymerase sigma factor [Pyrinomonadaceae bacterium]